MSILQISKHLPLVARERLIAASALPTEGERLAAIAQAERENKRVFPEYYSTMDYRDRIKLEQGFAAVVTRSTRSVY